MEKTSWGARPIIGWDFRDRNPDKPQSAINYSIAGVKSFLPMFCTFERFVEMVDGGPEMTKQEVTDWLAKEHAEFLAMNAAEKKAKIEEVLGMKK